MKHLGVLVLAVAGVLTAAGVTDARAADGAPRFYDEEALVRYALAHNPALHAARWDTDIAAAAVTTESALKNPVLRGEWLHVQSPADYGWGVGVEWTPPQPGVFGARKSAARARARAAKDTYAETAADLEASVRTAWAEVSALGEQVQLAAKSVETRQSIADAVRQRLARGAASRIDLSLVTVSVARGEQERDLLVAARDAAKANLSRLSGLPADGSFELATPGASTAAVVGVRERPATDDSALVRRALSTRPSVRADAARTEAARADVSAERAARWPWLGLQARYRHHDQSNYPDDVTVGVELTLPLLDRNRGPIAAAEAALGQARDQAAAHRYAVEQEVRFLDAERRRRAAIARHYAESLAPVLSDHAALVKQALAGMELDVTAVLAAEDAVTHGNMDYVSTRLAARKADIALARATGGYTRAAARTE